MPTSELQLTGPPRISYFVAGSPAPVRVDVLLKHAATEDHVRGVLFDESAYVYLTERRGRLSRLLNRHRYSFGYEYMADDEAREFIRALSKRRVLFTARTWATGDPGSADDEVEHACLVVSDIPRTKHLTRGYRVHVELEAI